MEAQPRFTSRAAARACSGWTASRRAPIWALRTERRALFAKILRASSLRSARAARLHYARTRTRHRRTIAANHRRPSSRSPGRSRVQWLAAPARKQHGLPHENPLQRQIKKALSCSPAGCRNDRNLGTSRGRSFSEACIASHLAQARQQRAALRFDEPIRLQAGNHGATVCGSIRPRTPYEAARLVLDRRKLGSGIVCRI